MRELTIELNIRQSKQLSKESVKSFAELLMGSGFILLRNTKGKLSRVDSKEDVSGLIDAHARESGPTPKTGHSDTWSVLFRAYPSQLSNFNNSVFEAQYRSFEQNRLTITGLFDLTQDNQVDFIVRYSELLRRVAIEAYPILRPGLCVVDAESRVEDSWKTTDSEVAVINWVNLWGPSYVAKYGREFLLGMPGYRTVSLKDGAIWHQLSPSIIIDSGKDAEELRGNVVKYCAAKNVDVTCYAPYTLADSS